jgi:hypothetical protein
MPSLRRPDHSTPPSPPHSPLCPHCGERMRLVVSVPDQRYINLDHLSYICECGESVTQVVAHEL